MDLFSTNSLVARIEDLRSRPAGLSLLSLFFPQIIEETSEEVHFDSDNKPRRIAPFVHPLKEGRLIESEGYVTSTLKPAYLKPKTVFDATRPLKRIMGEPITGAMSPEARMSALVSQDLMDHINMIRRRKEVMAGEALTAGTVTIAGDGYPSQVVNFGRAAGHSIDLSGGAAEWGDAGISPVENIETWSELVLKTSGAGVTDVVFTPSAWSLFRADTKFAQAVDLLRAGSDAVNYSARISTGLNYLGQMGQRRLWIYYDWYVNEAGTEVPIIADNRVILGSASIEGVQLHGAIKDHQAGYVATEYWSKSWVQEDPSVRYLMTQSAPLVAPFRANASLCAIVT